MDNNMGMKCERRLICSLSLPTTILIRNFLVKRDTSARVWIYYIESCNVNSDVRASRRTIENILNKSFGLVCWLNNKNFRVWKKRLFLKTNKEVCFGYGLSSSRTK